MRRQISGQSLAEARAARWQSFHDAGLDAWNGVWSFAPAAARWAAAGFTDPAEALAYKTALVDYCEPAEAYQWRQAGFTPDEAAAWARSGHGPELAAQERAQGKQPRRYTPGVMRTR